MQKRWHYIYVILYPQLGYKFYYGSRITTRHPDDDIHYFGSPKTFKRYNDVKHSEYQATALKVILWAQFLPRNRKNAQALGALEVQHIDAALKNVEHLGRDVCLNRNSAGIIFLSPEERKEAVQRSFESGSGFHNMEKTRHIKFAIIGGNKSYEMRTGVHGISKEKLAAAQKRGRNTIAKKYAKTYTFTNPNGVPTTITNLNRFCRDNNLNRAHMRSLHAGRLKSHKGWTKHE